MPMRSRRYRSRKSRYSRRRRPFIHLIAAIPTKAYSKMRYVSSDTGGQGLAATTFISGLYRANGAFDPYAAAGGQSCIGWGYWAARYNFYCVLRSQITFRSWLTPNTQNPARDNTPWVMAIRLQESPALSLAGKNWRELNHITPGLKCMICQPNEGINTDAHRIHAMSKKFTASKFARYKDITQSNEWWGRTTAIDVVTSTANFPDRQWYYEVALACVASADTKYVSYHIEIDYDIMFVEPKKTNYWATSGWTDTVNEVQMFSEPYTAEPEGEALPDEVTVGVPTYDEDIPEGFPIPP